jgi:hypothetical protein
LKVTPVAPASANQTKSSKRLFAPAVTADIVLAGFPNLTSAQRLSLANYYALQVQEINSHNRQHFAAVLRSAQRLPSVSRYTYIRFHLKHLTTWRQSQLRRLGNFLKRMAKAMLMGKKVIGLPTTTSPAQQVARSLLLLVLLVCVCVCVCGGGR